jgi:hypothetical protein
MNKLQDYNDDSRDTFEILGSYVVGVFYTHLYDQAQIAHKNGKSSSITEAYRASCQTYVLHFQNEKQFNATLKNIYENFKQFKATPLLTYGEWVSNFVKVFVPSDFYTNMQDSFKDRTLALVISDVIKDFCNYVLTPKILKMIIDERGKKANVIFLQDQIIQIQIQEHAKICQRFLKNATGTNKVDAGVAEKLRQDLIAENKKVHILKEHLKKAAEVLKEHEKRELDYKTQIEEYKKYVAKLKFSLASVSSNDTRQQLQQTIQQPQQVRQPPQPVQPPQPPQSRQPVAVQKKVEVDTSVNLNSFENQNETFETFETQNMQSRSFETRDMQSRSFETRDSLVDDLISSPHDASESDDEPVSIEKIKARAKSKQIRKTEPLADIQGESLFT